MTHRFHNNQKATLLEESCQTHWEFNYIFYNPHVGGQSWDELVLQKISKETGTTITHHSDQEKPDIGLPFFMVGGWSEPGMREIDYNYRKNRIIDAAEKIKTMLLN